MSRFSPDILSKARAFVHAADTEPGPSAPHIEAITQAIILCKLFEGFFPNAYLCPGGYPTIGFGTRFYEDGIPVTLRDPPISRGRAEELLFHQISTEYLPSVLRLCPTLDSASRLGAIVDFCYNLGPRNLAASTLRKKILSCEWNAVSPELRKWINAAGRPLRGLVNRREAEVALFQK